MFREAIPIGGIIILTILIIPRPARSISCKDAYDFLTSKTELYLDVIALEKVAMGTVTQRKAALDGLLERVHLTTKLPKFELYLAEALFSGMRADLAWSLAESKSNLERQIFVEVAKRDLETPQKFTEDERASFAKVEKEIRPLLESIRKEREFLNKLESDRAVVHDYVEKHDRPILGAPENYQAREVDRALYRIAIAHGMDRQLHQTDLYDKRGATHPFPSYGPQLRQHLDKLIAETRERLDSTSQKVKGVLVKLPSSVRYENDPVYLGRISEFRESVGILTELSAQKKSLAQALKSVKLESMTEISEVNHRQLFRAMQGVVERWRLPVEIWETRKDGRLVRSYSMEALSQLRSHLNERYSREEQTFVKADQNLRQFLRLPRSYRPFKPDEEFFD